MVVCLKSFGQDGIIVKMGVENVFTLVDSGKYLDSGAARIFFAVGIVVNLALLGTVVAPLTRQFFAIGNNASVKFATWFFGVGDVEHRLGFEFSDRSTFLD